MELNQSSRRIHPLIAGAAGSVILVSLLGVAAITGFLPNSHGTVAQNQIPNAVAPSAPDSNYVNAADSINMSHPYSAPAPVVHHARPARHAATSYAQSEPSPSNATEPVYQPQPPVAKNSPVGIGIGAVIGGLLGSQVGGGSGRTIATIAGAVGGGYLGNEVAKRNP